MVIGLLLLALAACCLLVAAQRRRPVLSEPEPEPRTSLSPNSTVRIAMPDGLHPLPTPDGSSYVYWDGSAEAGAASAALHELPPAIRALFEEAVAGASLTVRLADDEDIRLLAPDCLDPHDPAVAGAPLGLYLPGKCILVAVDCDDPADIGIAGTTAVHEAMHAIDDYLGDPPGVADDYVSDEEGFQRLVAALPPAVEESFRTWGYPDHLIAREIFAEGGAAYLANHGADKDERALAIGHALTCYADSAPAGAALTAGRMLDRYFSRLERRLDVTPVPK